MSAKMYGKQKLQVIQCPSWYRFYEAHLPTKQQNKADETRRFYEDKSFELLWFYKGQQKNVNFEPRTSNSFNFRST